VACRFDLDVHPVTRRQDPKMFGYIPDKSRGLVFGIMLGISACTMASQVFNFILLLKMSGTALAIYLVVPMVLYVHSPNHLQPIFQLANLWLLGTSRESFSGEVTSTPKIALYSG
jgi:hypothetical protein